MNFTTQNTEQFTRRKFLKLSSLCAGQIVMSTSLTGCNSMMKTSRASADFSFNHGVASGDPLADGFIIWTRATPIKNDAEIIINWEVAEDDEFLQIIRTGSTLVTQSSDFTLKVDVRGLKSSQIYYYRFLGESEKTVAGRCKTLPVGEVNQLKFIVCSCANYPAGYFHAYAEAAKQKDIDAVLHLGDYLYEYGMGQYATEHAKELGRELPKGSDKEMISLDDYRNRYNLYRSDKSLQKLHASAAFILIWDDHEIANDTWREGAQNHTLDEGSFAQRKYNAIKAWYEWQPVRVSATQQKQQIYRSFDFGNLLSLHMLDTRLIARDKQLKTKDYTDKSTKKFNSQQFERDLKNERRTLLGKEQFSWLEKNLESSNSTWQLLGQQVLMGRMLLPADLSKYRKNLHKAPQFLNDLSALKNKIKFDKSLESKDWDFKKFPYNMDAWDGYPFERDKLFNLVKENHKNLVVVAGDTHNAWANNLTDEKGDVVGVEFAVHSITSPGMEKYLKMDSVSAKRTANSLTNLVDDLRYCNLHQRGFLKLTINRNAINADWVFIDDILSKNYEVVDGYSLIHKLDVND